MSLAQPGFREHKGGGIVQWMEDRVPLLCQHSITRGSAGKFSSLPVSPSPVDCCLLVLFRGHLRASLVAKLVKNLPANVRDMGSIPRLGRSPGEGNSYPLQYSGLENSMDYIGSDGKASAYNEGDPGSSPGSGISPGEGNGNPLQHSCLENPTDGGA